MSGLSLSELPASYNVDMFHLKACLDNGIWYTGLPMLVT